MRLSLRRGNLLRSSALAALLIGGAASSASAADPTYQFNIPAESLSQALTDFGQTSSHQIIYTEDLVRGRKSAGLHGNYTAEQALEALLVGTDLKVNVNAAGVMMVQLKNAQAASNEAAPDVETVTVTGSRIPQSTQGPQDVKLYDRKAIEQSGQTSVADFLNTLPDVSISINENGLQTFPGAATTVQLHGLPIGTTLILLNGRRLESSGSQQGQFFDLNNIPLSAIDHIEVLSEGASAVYGSDAIAGVVNIIMKKDFSGLEASLKYGAASGIDETNASLAWGHQWDRGGISIVGSYQTRSELEGFERALTATDDKTRFGGSNQQLDICNPGTIFSTTGANLPGLNAPYAAVPAGYTGTPSQQEFAATAGTINSCNIGGYASLIPATQRAGVFASANYRIGDSIEVFAELMYSDIQQKGFGVPPFTFALPGFTQNTISAANPFNPFGQDVGISYLFTSVGRQPVPVKTDFFRPLVGLRGSFFNDWSWELAGWDSQDKSRYSQMNSINSVALQAALDSTNPATALNLFTAGSPGSPELLRSILVDQVTKYRGDTKTLSADAHGSLFSLPAGSVEAALGAEYDQDTLYSNQINVQGAPPNNEASYHRTRYAIYGELRIPVLDNDRLVATAAGRYDHYSDFGSQFTPQFGAEWRPSDEFLIRATYGKAFKAPGLYNLYQPTSTFPSFVTDPRDGNLYAIMLTEGGNPKLQPETGQSRTLGINYTSQTVPGLQGSITAWSVDEGSSIQSITPQVIVDNENLFPGLVVRNSSGTITSVNATFVNFGNIAVDGIDYHLSYALDSALGKFTPSVSATQTYRFTTSLVPGAPATSGVSVANDDGSWAPRWKGTVALDWELGAFSANVAGRYVGPYQDYDSTSRIGNFWLFDFSSKIEIGKFLLPDDSPMAQSYLEMGGVNIFNNLPQFSNYNFGSVGYDPAEADIRGRFLYVQLGIKW